MKMYILKTQTQFGKKVKIIRHDAACEFDTSSIFNEGEDIEQQIIVPYGHYTNKASERAIRTIVTIGRSILHLAKLSAFRPKLL